MSKRNLYTCRKRPICISKETYTFVERDQFKKRLVSMSKRNLYTRRKRPICISKETYIHVERDQFKKRLVGMSKRNLYTRRQRSFKCQNNPMHMSNETDSKRD